MASPLLVVADASLDELFDDRTFQRGLKYAEQGRVTAAEWFPAELELVGEVEGSQRNCYVSTLRFARRRGVLEVVDSDCTCPVGYQCKHAVALAITACMPASAVAVDAQPSWEATLGDLLPEHEYTDTAPLALQLNVTRRRPDATPGPAVTATLRPAHRGKTGWIAGKLNWSNLAYAQSPDGRRFAPEHLRILRELYGLYLSAGRYGHYGYGSDKTLNLAAFDSPALWTMLATAHDAGIPLVHGKRPLDETPAHGRYQLHVTDDDGDVTITPVIRVEGLQVTPLSFIGADGHGVVYIDPADPGERFRLARLDPPAPARSHPALFARTGLRVPAGDRHLLLTGYYPRIRHVIDADSEIFSAPTISGPTLVLELGYGPSHTVRVGWRWEYSIADDRHLLPLDSRSGHQFRDSAAERTLLTELPADFQGVGLEGLHPLALGPATAELTGTNTLQFTTHVLPPLREHPSVRIETHGTATDYRDAGDSLVIEVSTAPSDSGTDWFDLDITISVESHAVPFREVFTALCADDTHMILPDGAYFALDRPELQTLRSLIDEARALHDATPDRLQISRYQAGFWDELTELGVVTRQADEWQQQVRGLLDTTAIDNPPTPTGLTAELRHYQQEGFAWLTFLWQHRLGGILADDMGLGKTLQALALVCHARQHDPAAPPWLIIAPASVVPNWVGEAARFAPALRVTALTDTLRRSGRDLAEVAATAEVIVTSYTLLRLDADSYLARSWSGLLLDEAQFVKNHQAKTHQCARRVDAPFRLAITGTPMENNLMELWSLLSIVAPGLFPHPAKFRDYYATPIEKGCDTERLARLQRRIAPLLRRRTKEQVATELPPKLEQTLHVDLSPKHRKIYDTRLQHERRKVLGLLDDVDRNRLTILTSLTALRQLSLHAALIDDNHDAVESAKLEALLEHLDEVAESGHRALVFSQFTRFLTRLRDRLDREGIACSYLDGRTRKRAEAIERFRGGTAPVFLISLKAGGFGLNLTEADYCFILDPWWNPATEAQAVDRVHRIGQTNTVMVYRLIANDTIEDKVMRLKQRKAALFDGVFDDAGGGFAGQLGADDIRALFD
ncbi:SNF2-related protein [Nocardia sp. NPDC088792]|uniref:DEAD/DEAH box helicase n=1 Tax=Nocardia sp. NPDC088792 TaxID=3364332 RepID=UPI003815D3D2